MKINIREMETNIKSEIRTITKDFGTKLLCFKLKRNRTTIPNTSITICKSEKYETKGEKWRVGNIDTAEMRKRSYVTVKETCLLALGIKRRSNNCRKEY